MHIGFDNVNSPSKAKKIVKLDHESLISGLQLLDITQTQAHTIKGLLQKTII